jgi:hypothetical protein
LDVDDCADAKAAKHTSARAEMAMTRFIILLSVDRTIQHPAGQGIA